MSRKLFVLAVIAMIMACVGTSAIAGQIAYVITTCTPGATQNPLYTGTYARTSTNLTAPPLADWTANGTTTGHFWDVVGTTFTDRTVLASSGTGYWFERTTASWGQWNFTVPTGKSGYYKVYTAWPQGASWMPCQQPQIWKVVSEGSPATDVVVNLLETTATANRWQAITSGEVQMNEGQTYSLRCTTPILPADDNTKRVYFGGAAFVYQRSNTPTELTATGRSDGSAIDLMWSEPTPTPATYTIERSDDSGATWNTAAGWPVTGVVGAYYSDTSGICNLTYQYRVRAVDASGVVSGVSNVASALKCSPTPPDPATNPSPVDGATTIHTDLAQISWIPGGGTALQSVYFGTDPAALVPVAQGLSPLVTSYAQGALLPNTDYYWRIDENNSAGTTTGSVWHFKTGVKLTIEAIRSRTHGVIQYPVSPDPMSSWGGSAWCNAGDILSFVVAPNSPYTFEGWSTSATGSPIFDTNPALDPSAGNGYVVPDANATLYAVFGGVHYTLSVNAQPSEGGTVEATNMSWPAATLSEFELGEVAHLVATPAAGYVFAGWMSDKSGSFVDQFAATTNYTMTSDNTTIRAHFAHAVANITNTGTRCISAQNLAGAGEDWWTTQCNIGFYSPANSQFYARDLVTFKDSDGFVTIPATSLQNGLAKVTATHIPGGSYSSSTTLKVSCFPVTTPWLYSTTDAGATWLTTDGTNLWTVPGGDMGAELGTAQSFVGVPATDSTKSWILAPGPDYRTLLANGLEFKGDREGDITYRKGFGKNTALSFFYDPPTGPANVIRDWAYLGAFMQGTTTDHQLRIDTDQVAGTYGGVPVDETTLAPKAGSAAFGNSYGTASWAYGSSSTDAVDLQSPNFYNNPGAQNCSTYCSVYVKNPGTEVWPTYVALGADDYAKVWTNGIYRGSKAVAELVRPDATMIGPFHLQTGWTRLLVKVENGSASHGLYARLANADRTAVTGLTFATTDSTPPANPTGCTEAGGAISGVPQSSITSPTFTWSGAVDPEVAGEGVSGVRGYKVYFGTDQNALPSTFQTATTYAYPGTLMPGVYYLRVSTIDYALNESAPTTLFELRVSWLIPDAKMFADGTPVTLSHDVVAAVVDGGFYAERSDRSGGIKVLANGAPVATGQFVDVEGTMGTDANAERYIVATSVVAGGPAVVDPLSMTNKAIGGADWNYDPGTGTGQKGVIDGTGLNNIGLLVRTNGAVAAVGSDYFIINDGSNARGGYLVNGIRVSCGALAKPSVGQNVVVTGISTIHNVRGNLYRCVLVTRQADISTAP